jgi:hypothetical protein
MLGGVPRPLDLALSVRRFEGEVQAPFAPRCCSASLAPLRWLARRGRDTSRITFAASEQLLAAGSPVRLAS